MNNNVLIIEVRNEEASSKWGCNKYNIDATKWFKTILSRRWSNTAINHID